MNMNNILLQQLQQNPYFNIAQRMTKGKSKEEIEQVARNLCAEKGLNYDEVLVAFQNQMKGFM